MRLLRSLWIVRCVFLLALGFASLSIANTATPDVQPIFGAYRQGALVGLSLPAQAHLRVDGQRVEVSADGRAIFGIGRDADHVDLFLALGKQQWQWQEAVAKRQYDIQRIDGLPESKVTPDPKVQAEIQQNNAQVAQLRQQTGLTLVPELPFDWPVMGRISGVYGSQRVLNGHPKRPHFGVDIAAAEGTPVLAPADGVVILAHPTMVLTGQTLMLDHGAGLKSIYVHLSAMSVRVGDEVRRGQQIGAVGKTGRATGPHLHWGVSWHKVQIDPALVATPLP
jgi:murein DD-endopeptidase MepM/ murein hydrolase activator NlpD